MASPRSSDEFAASISAIVVVRDGLDDGRGALGWVAGLEDAAMPTKTPSAPELHHERRVGRGGHAAGGEVHDGELARASCTWRSRLQGHLQLLGRFEQLVVAQVCAPRRISASASGACGARPARRRRCPARPWCGSSWRPRRCGAGPRPGRGRRRRRARRSASCRCGTRRRRARAPRIRRCSRSRWPAGSAPRRSARCGTSP